jgi:uncharacterized protein (DUF2141 family)
MNFPLRTLNQVTCFLLVSLLTFGNADRCSAQTGDLVITFTDIRSEKGIIALALCTDAQQWPNDPAQEYHWEKEGLNQHRMTITLPRLPYGTYAIAVLDDENRNFKMEYSMGLPREGWGMSTNPSFLKLTPPEFEECAFELDAPVVRMEIKMNYLRKNKKVN